MKIAELIVGQSYTVPLAVKSATAKKTKANKPYLALELFDGVSSISGNYWDWSSGNIPPVNAVLNVTATVTEWQGNKQLNIKALSANNEMSVDDFAPQADVDVNKVFEAAVKLMESVEDIDLKAIAVTALKELKPMWLKIPSAKGVHHAYIGGTLVHSYSVARIADDIVKNIPAANRDLCIVGAMLHDIGKLFTYKIDGVNIDLTNNGKLYEHLFIGAEFVGNFAESHVDVDNPKTYAKVRMLRHIILSHHGSLEFGSPVTPQCIEAYIVHSADSIDATAEQLRIACKQSGDVMWTDRIYTLNNRPHLTSYYVKEAFTGHEETMQ